MLTNISKKRRHEIDIIIEILEIVKEGKLRTHIAGEARLNYAHMEKYLTHLKQKGLIEESVDENGLSIFQTSKRGLRAINLYHELTSQASLSSEMSDGDL